MSETAGLVRVGSVWRERDNRFERYVLVVAVPSPGYSKVTIQSCGEGGETFGARETKANISAFGKRYTLHREMGG